MKWLVTERRNDNHGKERILTGLILVLVMCRQIRDMLQIIKMEHGTKVLLTDDPNIVMNECAGVLAVCTDMF